MALDLETQLEKEPQWAAFVAIDWADKKHDWQMQVVDGRKREEGQFKNTPEALEDWAGGLYRRFDGRPVAVCLEQSRGALVYRLLKYPHLVLYAVNTTTIAGFRMAFLPSGSKSDPADSALLLDILLHHRDRLRRLDPDTVGTRKLQMLVEERRRMVNERTRLSNRLTNWMKLYYPQMLEWMGDIDSELSCAMLLRWPTLEELQRSHPGTIKTFFLQHNSRSEDRIRERLESIRQAKPAVNDGALMEVGPLTVKALARQIDTLRENIAQFDRVIEVELGKHEETCLFQNLPGAGAALLPRLIVAFGTKRERWEDAGALQSFSGIAPVSIGSGSSQTVHFRWACPKFLRQTFHEFAAHSIAGSSWAAAFYHHKREKMDHHAAVRALAFKWIRILMRCWKSRTPYDENTYRQSLEKHKSKITTFAEWEPTAGFQKLAAKKA